jgi:hypothetical protein
MKENYGVSGRRKNREMTDIRATQVLSCLNGKKTRNSSHGFKWKSGL